MRVSDRQSVGDVDHLKVFANEEAAEKWFAENDPEGVAFEFMQSWSEPRRFCSASREAANGPSRPIREEPVDFNAPAAERGN
jgi:hypothetical protein